jgi:succinate dehydrogenase/fumarate reductase flavoprotein subunit
MVEFFETETSVRFVLGPEFSDYHPNAPGGLPGGRSICAAPFDGRELGSNADRLRPPLDVITFVGMMIGSGKELLHFFNVTRSVVSAAYVGRLLMRYGRDLVTHGRAMRLTNGNALAGRLAKSAFDLGIPIWTSSPAKALVRRNGGIAGLIVETDGRRIRIEARRGVVLACGGFPHDIARRKALFPHAPTGIEHWSPAPPGNTGDGLRLGESVGAKVNADLPNAAAWVPVSLVPRRDGSKGVFPHFIDRAKPGVIAVTRKGRRFVNEGNSYHDFVQAMVRECRGLDEFAAYLICDHPTMRRYGLGFAKPAPLPISLYLRSGYLLRGQTLGELAATAGIDPAVFEETVRAYNEHAREGRDPEFHKGSTAYNRYLGDPAHRPNPCVGPVEQGPFYALRVVPGDLGTFAGLAADGHARVLDPAGRPIPGLYAAGNDLASIMGGNYPGGGITLGPAMTFGYIAGRHAAGVSG